MRALGAARRVGDREAADPESKQIRMCQHDQPARQILRRFYQTTPPPASAIRPPRGFGGAARVAANPTEDSNVKVCEESSGCTIRVTWSCDSARATAQRRGEATESRARHQTVPCHRDAAITCRCDDCCDDEGNRLAAALSARLSAGVVRKRLKLKLGSKKVDGERVYQITGGETNKSSSGRTSKRRPS
jgi:hypothetical protein